MIRSFKKVLFVTILGLLFLPLFQFSLNLFRIKPLKGAIEYPSDVTFVPLEWFSGEYQVTKENYLNDNFGFRPFFVRVNNQLSFSLFNRAHANGVVIGKNNYLYEENYIKAYYGRDFLGEDKIKDKINKLIFINDSLQKLNKTLILVFAAGKGSFYPEFIPDEYVSERGLTNNEVYVRESSRAGLKYIDFNTYFVQQKFKSKYPLYPQFGIHWSYYGMCLAADSIIRFIEHHRNIDMPSVYWEEVKTGKPRMQDSDIAEGMNILLTPATFKMAYPQLLFESDSNKVKPSILVVSDSYYWGMYDFGIGRCFTNHHFWYYNRQIYPESFKQPLETPQVSLSEQVANHDVFLIMATEATITDFGWGFIDNLYYFLSGQAPPELRDQAFWNKVRDIRADIKKNKEWMYQITVKAVQNGITTDSMLTLDAIWVLDNDK